MVPAARERGYLHPGSAGELGRALLHERHPIASAHDLLGAEGTVESQVEPDPGSGHRLTRAAELAAWLDAGGGHLDDT